MPAVSDKQRRAMAAAAAGKSTLGIPASVGREYMSHEGIPNHKQPMKPKTSTWKKPEKAAGGPPKRITTKGKPGDTGPGGANPARKQRAYAKMMRKSSASTVGGGGVGGGT